MRYVETSVAGSQGKTRKGPKQKKEEIRVKEKNIQASETARVSF
jgi:hypothetical protein